MKTLRTILLLAAVLLCLGACGRGKTAAEGTVRATDTIRYARNLQIIHSLSMFFGACSSITKLFNNDCVRSKRHGY